MKSILHVKNFGPIKDSKLDLRSVNVLIGPQASGKSTLAKLYTICKSPAMYHVFTNKKDRSILRGLDKSATILSYASLDVQTFFDSLSFYSLTGYINDKTEIHFESETHCFYFKGGKIDFKDNLEFESMCKAYSDGDIQAFKTHIQRFKEKSKAFEIDYLLKIYYLRKENHRLVRESTGIFEYIFEIGDDNQLFEDEIDSIFELALTFYSSVFENNAIYIPAERTIVNLIKQASLNFQRSNIPLPQHLLDYAAQYESASFNISHLDLGFLKKGVKYKQIKGEDRIFFNARESVKLTESASGFQSVIPMLLPLIQASDQGMKHFSFVIEEPETNLFPKAQYELLKFIEKDRDDDHGMIDWGRIHTYTTHSPFVLASLNNMLYAHKKGENASEPIKEKISSILPQENWMAPEEFSAYEIVNGKANSILDRETGLIDETVIDRVSEEILNDFRKIALASKESV